MRRIHKLLIANRGEIACRIQRSARSLGLGTVAVFSDADSSAPHVRLADEAVRIGPAPSAESYLRIEALVEAARRTGADAVHPGFGFLAENARFAQACLDAGLVFVGPRPAAIAALGSKREAKRLAAAAGVPVVPGYAGDDQSVAALTAAARDVGFPLLLKASAGGGGKGMQIVRAAAELGPALESAKRVAAAAFGDDTLLLERYVERPRHVEIQILGDEHGHLVHLFERECSIQRRHQKIVEESPSPALDAELRERMGEAAVAAGRAVSYSSAGTVEFILGEDQRFYFLEVNTRLQVEHPVTECVTGVDIVAEQLRIARGERLRLRQAELGPRGHAIEVRLYAESPEDGFLPQTGRLLEFEIPALDGLRVDSGVETGSEIGIHYDPMLAKVIAHAPTRDEAIQRLIRALSGASVLGVVTNRGYLARVLDHEAFRAGATHTHFVEEHAAALAEPPASDAELRFAATVVAVAAHERRRAERTLLPALEPGFRVSRFAPERVELRVGEREVTLTYENLGGGALRVTALGETAEVRVVEAGPRELVLEIGGHRRRARHATDGARWHVHSGGRTLAVDELPRFPEKLVELAAGACVAPMPGKIVRVACQVGSPVEAGQVLVILEAMKMEHSVRAPVAGTVRELAVAEGAQVDAGAVLVLVE
ncbi:MAG: ATP-grasp domain-containing protein [Polyangiaceae bacterium]|nr:ATP-grasp domain-containing protein [Polyangiaceae bacterium]